MSAERIKVLHCAASLGIGGTEKVMQTFAETLDPERFEVAVHSPADGVRAAMLREKGIPTYIGMDLFRTLERFRPHIAHIHRAGWTEPGTLKPFRTAGTPAVVETNVFGRLDPSPEARVISRTLFVSRFCLERFHRLNGIRRNPARYDYLYNPVDTDLFESAARVDRDFSRPAAARISRPDPGKWSAMALTFLPALVERIPDFRYHVIGAIDEARDFVHKHGLDTNVIFHAPVETDREIASFLDQSSVLAHANDTGESFGLVIAEAMACGLPVVTHPAEGERDNAQLELVDDGVTGIIAKNASEYGAALEWLFANPESARAMGQAGREKAARLYRRQIVTRRLEAVYEEVLASVEEA
ncbi:glycosyltransferase family 4 protein [Desulfovibrio oxyclinae]|uniref:glycosyltransferase family 4 protein n=1 Tax=Desulfovibrio oxyclinae TaxID=63560 RepID=UPI0003A41BE6|nr:glycosyltransferase family 4 protein [Desulfovibrio oxyclinae]